MSAPDPDSFSFVEKVIAAGASVAMSVWGARTWLESKFSKKADKADIEKCLNHCERLYQNAEADRKLTRDLHDKAMEKISENQRTIIGVLTNK